MPLKEGEVARVEVTDVTESGIFVRCEGLVGLVNVTQLSWEERNDPFDFARKGDWIDVFVEWVNPDGVHFTPSIKLLHPEENPWRDPSVYAPGTRHQGYVDSIARWGTFVRLDGGAYARLPTDRAVGLRIRERVEVVSESIDHDRRTVEARLVSRLRSPAEASGSSR